MYKVWSYKTFIFNKKPNVAIEGGWEKEENGLMVKLDLPCCIFDENELEMLCIFLEMVDAFSKWQSDKSLPKFNADEYN